MEKRGKWLMIFMFSLIILWLIAGIISGYFIPYVPWTGFHAPMVIVGTFAWALATLLHLLSRYKGETVWAIGLRNLNAGQGQGATVLKAIVCLAVVCIAWGWLTPSVLGVSTYFLASSTSSVEISQPTVERLSRTTDTYRINVTGKFEGQFDWDRDTHGFPAIRLHYPERRTIACLHLDYRSGRLGVIVESVRDCTDPSRPRGDIASSAAQPSKSDSNLGSLFFACFVVVAIFKIVVGLRTGKLNMFATPMSGYVYCRETERSSFYRGIVILVLASLMFGSLALFGFFHQGM